MKLLLISGVFLLLAIVSITESGQVRKRGKSEECVELIAANPLRAPCYKALLERDAETFCKMKEDCQEFLESYFTFAGNETRVEKEKVVGELMEKWRG